MEIQGAELVNTAYYDDLIKQVNSIDLCADLQSFVSGVMASLQAEVDAIHAQIAAVQALLNIPHDLGSVIAWITAQIAPYQATYAKYLAQLTATLAAIARLTAAIQAAAARLTNCSITVLSIA